MAKKKSKKRRVRKASKSRKTRKASKSSRKGRRKNPGNFVKPTAKVAQVHLDHWAKQGVTTTTEIKIGLKAPYVGELKNDADVKLAKIRFGEAQVSVKEYNQRVGTEGLSVPEAYKQALQTWKETEKAARVGLARPAQPGSAASAARGGNFRPISKARAKAYLERVFRWNTKLSDKDVEYIKQLGDRNAGQWLHGLKKMKRGDKEVTITQSGRLGARLAEAVSVLGTDKAAEIFLRAQQNALKAATKKADALAKKDAANRASWEKQLAALQDKINKVQEKLGAVAAVSARKRSRMKKAKKSRRRNPISRRRNPAKKRGRKKLRRRSKSKAKKAKRGRRKAKRGRKASRKTRRRRR